MKIVQLTKIEVPEDLKADFEENPAQFIVTHFAKGRRANFLAADVLVLQLNYTCEKARVFTIIDLETLDRFLVYPGEGPVSTIGSIWIDKAFRAKYVVKNVKEDENGNFVYGLSSIDSDEPRVFLKEDVLIGLYIKTDQVKRL